MKFSNLSHKCCNCLPPGAREMAVAGDAVGLGNREEVMRLGEGGGP